MNTPKGIKIGNKYTVFYFDTKTGLITKVRNLTNITILDFNRDTKELKFKTKELTASIYINKFNEFYTLQEKITF